MRRSSNHLMALPLVLAVAVAGILFTSLVFVSSWLYSVVTISLH